ncbi:MAG: diaminopimelate decarboxylase [Candidatus Handelsmanbacteria bacterium]|nr:diaminopimelate decarboxylase [Candidatus Handelsmanbacteria bacterium]
MERFAFLSAEQVRTLQTQFGTPVFVYDQHTLEEQARQALAFPNAFGLRVRYAMKACPNTALVRLLNQQGLHLDVSSGFEALRALRAGVPAAHLQLTAQQLADNLQELVERGVRFNACSLHQLCSFGQFFPGRELSIRFNPGLGSGHNNRTNVGGLSSSFGIWHEYLDQVLALQRDFSLQITALHSHIGSGSDPEVWQRCARMTLGIAARLPQVQTVNLGGGFKVGRMPGEVSTDLQAAGRPIVEEFERFAREQGRKLLLEIEPGTFFAANAGAVVCTAIDVVDTGPTGYAFIKVDSGMTEVLRPSLYGAQHPIAVVPAQPGERGQRDYLVVGHCCESGDVLTPEPGNPEGLKTRTLTEARIGDAVVIGGSGAYCAGMAAKNYNSFPEAPEVLLDKQGRFHLLRQRQTLDQVLANEAIPEFLKG